VRPLSPCCGSAVAGPRRKARVRGRGRSVWQELPPGEAAYPCHLHLAEEGALVVLDGRPSLRTPAGWRELEPGEVVSFPVGEAGAHQVVNRGADVVRFLAISTHEAPDIVLYPDSGKLGAAGARRSARRRGGVNAPCVVLARGGHNFRMRVHAEAARIGRR
jgi:hypothetical protein